MATGSSHTEPVTADDVLMAQFTFIKKGGYDQQEVDAFLDRIAATLDADASLALDGSLTANDVRHVEFAVMKRGGYSPEQVDSFLDRIVAVFTTRVSEPLAQDRLEQPEDAVEPAPVVLPEPDLDPVVATPEPEPIVVAEVATPIVQPVALAVEPTPVVEVAPVAAPTIASTNEASGFPQLHDPEGAAQRLLAAAQVAADSLTGNAENYALGVRGEADQHAAAARAEADKHAASVTAGAETQAAAIREVAADEARRVVEEARAKLVAEITVLEARKSKLDSDNAALQGQVEAERSRILVIIDGLRSAVSSETEPASASVVPSPAPAPAPAPTPVAAAVPVRAVEEEDPDPSPDVAPVIELVDGSNADAGTDSVARSVFDISPDAGSPDTSTDWLDEPGPGAGGSIFDIESPESGNTTQAVSAVDGAGDRFFEELRQADPDADALGPLDEDTDAALSAFFDESEERPSDGRWRDRFGPSRD
jgi:DivIVA domain-containing protein